MSLATNLQDLATCIATEVKSLRTLINGNAANLDALTTTAKTSLVAALNDLQGQINTLAGDAAGINDAVQGSGSTWSSTKIVEQLEAYKSSILGGASGAYDTLIELEAFLTANGGEIAAITTALSNRVRADAAQSFTDPQKAQARSNIGAASAADVGNPTTNFVTTFEAGLV